GLIDLEARAPAGSHIRGARSGIPTRVQNSARLLGFYAKAGGGAWNIRDFVQMRVNYLQEQKTRRPVDPAEISRHIINTLGGHSVMESKTVNHFINVHVDPSGHIT